MNKLLTTLFLLLLTMTVGAQEKSTVKPRVLISTDIGGTDPDDNQSVTHLLQHQHNKALMKPNALRKLVKQGRQSEMPVCGYAEPTEGSKWGVNSYCYIIEHFPHLWMIVGDTPSLLYMMSGHPENPEQQSWAGRHSTYYTGTLDYTITSTIDGFVPIKGQITVENTWDVAPKDTDYKVGSQWWTDSCAPADYWHNCAGAQTQRIVRDEIMTDWANRWQWLKE